MAKSRDSVYDDQLDEELLPDDEQAELDEDAYGDEDDYDAYDEGEPAPEDSEDADDTDPEGDAGDAEDGEVNETEYFDKLFDYLVATLESGTSVPLTTKKLVDTEACFKILDDMKENLPDAIQYGIKIHGEQDRILSRAEKYAKDKVASSKVHGQSIIDEAQQKANRIVDGAEKEADAIVADAQEHARAVLEDAEARAKKLVSEEEIVRRAHEEARIEIENARSDARARRLQAVSDAYRLLDALEKQTRGISESLGKKRDELRGADR